MHQARGFAGRGQTCGDNGGMCTYVQVELTDLEWQRQAPNPDPASFLLTADGSNRLDPHGQTVVFVKEG